MTARFAGSRTLDERRRRRLATNEMEQAEGTSGRSPQQEEVQVRQRTEARTTQFPLRKLISPKGWKIACLGFLAFLLGGGIVALGTGKIPLAVWLHPAWLRLFDSPGLRLPRLFHGLFLIAAGQLAMLIGWGRGRSLRDFDGRYRVWRWTAFASMFAGCCLLSDFHWAWSETICPLWSARFPMREVVCWMFPAGLVAGILWRKIRADIRDCRWSTCLFWLAGLSAVGACLFRLEIDRTGWPTDVKQLASESLQMLASVSVFVSFLVHARYVLHISPEPPEARPSLMAKLLAGLIAVLKKLPMPKLKLSLKRKGKKQGTKNSKTSAKKPEPEKNAAAKETQPRKESRRSGQAESAIKREKPKPAKPEPAPAKAENNPKPAEPKPQPSQPPAEEQKKETAAEKQPNAEPKLRVDQPVDPAQLKGLSKKERRRLRKQHRESQRKNSME